MEHRSQEVKRCAEIIRIRHGRLRRQRQAGLGGNDAANAKPFSESPLDRTNARKEHQRKRSPTIERCAEHRRFSPSKEARTRDRRSESFTRVERLVQVKPMASLSTVRSPHAVPPAMHGFACHMRLRLPRAAPIIACGSTRHARLRSSRAVPSAMRGADRYMRIHLRRPEFAPASEYRGALETQRSSTSPTQLHTGPRAQNRTRYSTFREFCIAPTASRMKGSTQSSIGQSVIPGRKKPLPRTQGLTLHRSMQNASKME